MGLGLRHDWGPQYTARQFNDRISGTHSSSPAFVGEPECNGLIERFMRTLKEECLYVHRFRSLEHAMQVVADFIGRYNPAWLLDCHGHMTPA